MTAGAMWDEGFSGWTVNYIQDHYWQMANRWDVEDLLQDGYILYRAMLEMFGHLSEKELFGIYRQRFVWHFKDEVCDRRRERGVVQKRTAWMPQYEEPDTSVVDSVMPCPPPKVEQLLAKRQGNIPRFPRWAWKSRSAMNKYLSKKLRIPSVDDELVVLIEQWAGTRMRHAVLPST